MANGREKEVVTLLNRSKRHFDLGRDRRVAPGEAVEVTVEEAKKFSSYKELVDASKLSVKGLGSAETTKLKADNAALTEENAKLKEQLSGVGEEKKNRW